MDQKDELLTLKQDIINELSPLVDESMPPEEKVGTYMAIAYAMRTIDAVKSAYQAVKAVPDNQQKANALLELLELVSVMQDEKQEETETGDGVTAE